jgi:hypothetical protein
MAWHLQAKFHDGIEVINKVLRVLPPRILEVVVLVLLMRWIS